MPRTRKQPEVDERTIEQMETHVWGVRCFDRYLSDWGPCTGGKSVVIYAYANKTVAESQLARYKRRADFYNCKVVDLRTYRFTAKHTDIQIGSIVL
jgi:hypothetical protein